MTRSLFGVGHEQRPKYSKAPRADLRPEKDLWAAVLMQAIEDLAKYNAGSASKRYLANASREWIESQEIGVGSFSWVCFSWDIDPIAARENLLKLPPEEIRRRLRFHRPGRSGEFYADTLIDCFKLHA